MLLSNPVAQISVVMTSTPCMWITQRCMRPERRIYRLGTPSLGSLGEEEASFNIGYSLE